MIERSAAQSRLLAWWVLFLTLLVAPWVLVFGSYQGLVIWLPGVVPKFAWGLFASFCFLAGAIGVIWHVLHTSLSLSTRILLALPLAACGLLLAMLPLSGSSCAPESLHVGSKPAQEVASCS